MTKYCYFYWSLQSLGFCWTTFFSFLNIRWNDFQSTLLTPPVHLTSGGTEPWRWKQTSNWRQDRVTPGTKCLYLLALTDLSWQLSGFKMPIWTLYRQKQIQGSEWHEAEEALATPTRAAVPVCATHGRCCEGQVSAAGCPVTTLCGLALHHHHHHHRLFRFTRNIRYRTKTTQQYWGAAQARPSQPVSLFDTEHWIVCCRDES